jgi:HAD superfamily hydrolase (TIGR01509 family)
VSWVASARVILLASGWRAGRRVGEDPARDVARELVGALRDDGRSVPDPIERLSDPFDVLRFAGTLGRGAAERTEARLRTAELAAARTAAPTPHAAELVQTWRSAGRRVAAVSNNSRAAVTAYLIEHGPKLDVIIGRTSPDPTLLKPSPHLVIRALNALGAAPEDAVFLGDSSSDIVAGMEAGIVTIGYASKPGKHQRLMDAGAQLVIDDLQALSRPVASG